MEPVNLVKIKKEKQPMQSDNCVEKDEHLDETDDEEKMNQLDSKKQNEDVFGVYITAKKCPVDN